MKTLTIRLPDKLAAAIDAEARGRGCSKSDIVRERLQNAAPKSPTPLDAIADLAGSVDALAADLSARKKEYLKSMGPLILTTDSDFRIYRRHSRQVVPCKLPA